MKKKLTEAVEHKGLELISIIAALTLWQVAADLIVKNKLLLPSFTDALASFLEVIENGVIFTDIWVSLLHFGIGLTLALVIGIPIGIIMGWFKTANRIFDPLIEIIRPIPPLAWIPLSILWFGIGDAQNEFIIFLGMFFPILINTIVGVKNVDPNLVRAARSLGAPEHKVLSRIVLKGSLPQIITGVRIGLGVGWMALVAAELVGANSGLGFLINDARSMLRTDTIVVGMLTIGLVGLLIDTAIRGLGRKLLPWSLALSK